jgi:hypothetical protein
MPYKNKEAQRAYDNVYQRQWRAKNAEKVRLRSRTYRAANLEKMRKKGRDWYAKNAVSEREKDRIRLRKAMPIPTRQEPACCEICGLTPTQSENGKAHAATTLCLDHCHTTKKFRGWICRACNLMLGYARDTPKVLRRAADYLERS